MVTPLMWLGLRAFIISLILTPIVRDIFRSYGVVDEPDGTRKLHTHPIPRMGGIAIAIGYFGALYLGGFPSGQISLVSSLVPPALVVFAVGLIDDFIGLKPWQKFAGQIAAAGLAYWAGVRIQGVAGYATAPWLGFVLTIVWLVACTNAFNLVDGLDGLAAGVGFFATLTIFTAAMFHPGGSVLAAATLPLAGCLLGFLCYNFSPATIFLGDSGSLLIGFLLGCYGAVWSQKSITLLGMTAPLMALSIPLMDMSLAVVRRFLRNQPIFSADRGHIHHRLIDLGLTPRRAVLLVYAVCGLAAALSLLQSFTRNFHLSILLIVLFCAVAWIGVRYLSYSEFILAGRFVRTGELQRALNAQMAIDSFARSLIEATDVQGCWTAIREHYRSFGFDSVHLRINGASYRDGDPWKTDSGVWTLRVAYSDLDFVELARPVHQSEMSMVVASAADLLHDALERLLHREERDAARAARAPY